MAIYDVVIQGGTVVDGSGSRPFRADVGIKDGRIVRVGKISDTAGAQVVDAEGHVVTPGFIDGHTHMDAQVMWDPLGTCSCWHGVTTVVMGNCGFTLAPVEPGREDLVVRNLERAEDIAPEAMAAGIDWRWETFPQMLDVLDQTPMAINYVANIGHCALRTWAMGERAFEEEADEDDLSKMGAALTAALQAGAVGFTTTRSAAHATSDDRPVASRLASWSEVETLVGLMPATGRRVFEITPSTDPEPEKWDAAFRQVCELAADTKVPTTFGLFGPPARREATLRHVEEAIAAGADIFVQTHSRGITNVLSLRSRTAFDRLPLWRELRRQPIETQLAAMRDPSTRAQLVAAANEASFGPSIGTEPRKPVYEAMTVLNHAVPPNETVATMAQARGMDPADLVIQLMLDTDGRQFFMQPITPWDTEETLLAAMKNPRGVMTFSDSGAHVSQIMDSSIHTYLLAYWVRARGAFTIEEAVRMMTAVPARAWGLADRGLLREGMVADVNVFDPATVGPRLPTVASDLPGGAIRLRQQADGFLATLVSGRIAFSNGEHTGALAGRLLRSGVA